MSYSSQAKCAFGHLQAFETNPLLLFEEQSVSINPQIHRLIYALIREQNVPIAYPRVVDLLIPCAVKKQVRRLIERHNVKMQAAVIQNQERAGEVAYFLPAD